MTEHQDRLHYLYQQFITDRITAPELTEFWQAMDALKEDDPIKARIFWASQRKSKQPGSHLLLVTW